MRIGDQQFLIVLVIIVILYLIIKTISKSKASTPSVSSPPVKSNISSSDSRNVSDIDASIEIIKVDSKYIISHISPKEDKWYAKGNDVLYYSKKLDSTYVIGHMFSVDDMSKLDVNKLGILGSTPMTKNKYPFVEDYLDRLNDNKYIVTDGNQNVVGNIMGNVPKEIDTILGWHNYEGIHTADTSGHFIHTYPNNIEDDGGIFVKINGDPYKAHAVFMCMMSSWCPGSNHSIVWGSGY